MNTSFYLLCLLVLIQFIFMVLIYDIATRKYRNTEKDFDKLWHVRMHENGVYNRIIILLKAMVRQAVRSGYKPDEILINQINEEYQRLIYKKEDENNKKQSKQN